MMAFVGMDPAAMRSVATSLRARGRELEDMVQTIDSLVTQCVGLWPGDASQGFHDTWHGAQRGAFASAAREIIAASQVLDREVGQQESASSGGQRAVPSISGEGAGAASWLGGALAHGVGVVSAVTSVAGVLGSVWNTQWYKGEKVVDWQKIVPHGGLLGKSLGAIGITESLAAIATAVDRRDLSGGLGAVGDLGFSRAPTPVSLLWTGLKTEVGFFIPLDAEGQDAHLAWMESQGHTPGEIAERYQGAQGFVQLGNDNVERQAPWANDIADAALQKPAEWLLAAGIDLG